MTWQTIAKLDVRGRRVMIKDSMIQLSANETEPEWPCVEAGPGEFVVEVKVNPDGCERVRARRDGASVAVGQKVGEVGVDHASFAIIDYESFLQAVVQNPEDYEEWTGMELDDIVWDQTHGEITFCDNPLVFGSIAGGDGVYDVFELTDNDVVVGLECAFVVAD